MRACLCNLCAWHLKKALGIPGTGVTDSCETVCGCWESNPGPLQEQVILPTESTLQPFDFIFMSVCATCSYLCVHLSVQVHVCVEANS